MPDITTLVDALSEAVVSKLAAASYPPLVDGKILLGRQYVAEHSDPPRIIMVPLGSDFGAADPYSLEHSFGDERQLQNQQRPIQTEFVIFEVRCWGASLSEDAQTVREDDFNVTQALAHAVIQCAWDVFGEFTSKGITVERGKWTDATYGGAQNVALGREFVFGLRLPTPVLDHLKPYAPSDVHALTTDTLQLPTGESEPGC